MVTITAMAGTKYESNKKRIKRRTRQFSGDEKEFPERIGKTAERQPYKEKN